MMRTPRWRISRSFAGAMTCRAVELGRVWRGVWETLLRCGRLTEPKSRRQGHGLSRGLAFEAVRVRAPLSLSAPSHSPDLPGVIVRSRGG